MLYSIEYYYPHCYCPGSEHSLKVPAPKIIKTILIIIIIMDSDFELWGEKWLHLMVKIITTCYHRLSTAAAGCDMVEKFWCVRISTFFPTFLYSTRKSTNLFQPIFSHGSKRVAAAPPFSSYKNFSKIAHTHSLIKYLDILILLSMREMFTVRQFWKAIGFSISLCHHPLSGED